MKRPKAILVVGAGDATGSAVSRRFAREGYIACVTRRNADRLAPLIDRIEAEGGSARAFGSDARDEHQVIDLVATIEREVGTIDVAVFNVGGNVRFPIRETSSRVYRKVWEMCALSGFLMGREVAKVMVPRGQGTIIFTGATASIRGGSGFSAFAGGKHALRALSQSMARELGPEGIHVAHVVVDGGIDTVFTRERLGEAYAEAKSAGSILDPDQIAENYWNLHMQGRSAWTHELDLRPWTETF